MSRAKRVNVGVPLLDWSDEELYRVWRAGIDSPHDTVFAITQAMRREIYEIWKTLRRGTAPSPHTQEPPK